MTTTRATPKNQTTMTSFSVNAYIFNVETDSYEKGPVVIKVPDNFKSKPGPVEIVSNLERTVFFERRKDVENHASYCVRNSYYRDNNMEGWDKEMKNIIDTSNWKLRVLNFIRAEAYRNVKVKEEKQLLSEKRARDVKNAEIQEKRRMNRMKNNMPKEVRKSSRLAKKMEYQQ
jgi:hypothetical protein